MSNENNSSLQTPNSSLNEKPEQTAEENKPEVVEEKPAEPEKFILKVSIPAERNFNLKLLEETTLKISM